MSAPRDITDDLQAAARSITRVEELRIALASVTEMELCNTLLNAMNDILVLRAACDRGAELLATTEAERDREQAIMRAFRLSGLIQELRTAVQWADKQHRATEGLRAGLTRVTLQIPLGNARNLLAVLAVTAPLPLPSEVTPT